MKATKMVTELVKLIGKYGPHLELVLTTKKNSYYSSFTIKDLTKDTGWVEITQD